MTVASSLRASAAAEAIRRERAVAILRRVPRAEVDTSVEALLRAGFAAIEFTLDSDDALDAIARWRADERALVGAGTIRRLEEVDPAVAAGAQFLVTPTYSEAVVERALELGVTVVSGAFTPSEIDAAWQQGATFVKLFPAGAVGPEYVRSVLAPLRDVEIVVTGGVDEASAPAFLAAGAVAVGASTGQLARDGDLEEGARRLLAAVAR